MILIGITGTLGAGKGTVVEYLVNKKGFAHYSARLFFTEEMEKCGLEINRDTMTDFANAFRREHGSGALFKALHARAQAAGENAVIESLRALGEVEELKSHEHAYLFGVDAEVRIRYDRIMARKSALDHVSFEEFRTQEEREMHSEDPAQQGIAACMRRADVIFENNGTVEELYVQVDEALKKFGIA